MRVVALIPARAMSKRVPGKNTRVLAGHPLVAYTIAAAWQSGVFTELYFCTDDVTESSECASAIAARYGAQSITRPRSDDDEPDIVWVRQALATLDGRCNAFSILRPTSPFRTAETIRRAYQQFMHDEVHSLRAVELAEHHPGKMWYCKGAGHPMTPVCNERREDGTPWHSSPTQTLPPVYVQNASLEMAWTYVVNSFGTISGTKIAPFFTEGWEGFDINTEEDWAVAEVSAESDPWRLPRIHANHSAV